MGSPVAGPPAVNLLKPSGIIMFGATKLSLTGGDQMPDANITVYGAPWCPDCKRSKQFLGEQRVAFQWVDIDEDEEGRRRVQEVNPPPVRTRYRRRKAAVGDSNGSGPGCSDGGQAAPGGAGGKAIPSRFLRVLRPGKSAIQAIGLYPNHRVSGRVNPGGAHQRGVGRQAGYQPQGKTRVL